MPMEKDNTNKKREAKIIENISNYRKFFLVVSSITNRKQQKIIETFFFLSLSLITRASVAKHNNWQTQKNRKLKSY